MNVLRSLVIFFAVVPVAFSGSLDATDQENISQHFNAYVDEGKIPHISILAHKNGKEIYRHAHGHADIESKTKISKDSIFRIYSMSKPVTGVAIMQLVEKGKLIHSPIRGYWIDIGTPTDYLRAQEIVNYIN